MAVHRHQQRPEAAHAELPQRLGIEVIEIDLLDRLDPRRLERGRAADDGEVGAAEFSKRLGGAVAQAPFADDEPHAVLLHQRAREALHAIAGRGADADRRIAGGVLRTLRHLAHIGRGVDRRVARQIEMRLAAAVEHVDQRRIAQAEERAVERHRIVDAQRSCLRFADRHREVVVRHHAPSSDFFRSFCTGLSPSQMRSSAR